MVRRLLLAGILAAGVVCAQRSGGGGGGGGGRGRDGGGMDAIAIPRRQARFDVIADKLKLNKEQKEEAGKIFDAAQESAAPLNEQIRTGRNRITQAIIQGSNSGPEFQQLTAAYQAVLAQMAGIEATAYGKLYASLKPNQQSKAPQVFAEQMAGMFMGRNWRMAR